MYDFSGRYIVELPYTLTRVGTRFLTFPSSTTWMWLIRNTNESLQNPKTHHLQEFAARKLEWWRCKSRFLSGEKSALLRTINMACSYGETQKRSTRCLHNNLIIKEPFHGHYTTSLSPVSVCQSADNHHIICRGIQYTGSTRTGCNSSLIASPYVWCTLG